MAEVLIFTHGKKHSGPNPGMTKEGFAEVRAHRSLLPDAEMISSVISGTGRRHINVADALMLDPDRYTIAVGGPDSLERRDGDKVIILSDGTEVPYEQYTTIPDMTVAMEELITSLPDGTLTVICAGRPSIMMLGKDDAKSGAVYRIKTKKGEIVSIEEIAATGVAEKGTV